MVSEEHMEMDELNQHECMLPLMKLLDHMQHNNLNPVMTGVSACPVCIHRNLTQLGAACRNLP